MAEQDDNKAFFSQQIEDNLDALYGVALRLAGSRADAEDLVADTAVKAWSAIDSLQERARFRPWIFRILRNCWISGHRRKSVRPAEVAYVEEGADDEPESLVSLLNEQPDEFLVWWAQPEVEFFNDLLGNSILAAIEKLPEAFRTTVLLINVEGLTYDECAEVLGVPAGTVRSRMKRGRTLLQKALWKQAREAGLVTKGKVTK
jgi:RNA polymerase sigma-70 factor (ECF subfamily)